MKSMQATCLYTIRC